MSDTTDPHPVRDAGDPEELDDPRVTQALEEYLAEVEAGRRPDRGEFLARHAALAGALAGCLDGLDFLTGSRGEESAGGESYVQESLVSRVADEFAEGVRRGERPDVEEYARRYPEAAGVLRDVLPALRALAGDGGEPAAEDPAPGCLGDYRPLREIGRGGMGVVYEAEQLSLGRRVALKVLPFAGTLDPKQLQRFRNEAQAAAHLNHPNIVPVYAVGCERGTHYYAMQLIDGRTVADVIRELRGLAGQEADEPATGHPSPGRTAPASGLAGGAPPAGLAPPPPPVDTVNGATAGAATKPSLPANDWRAIARLGVQAAEALDHAHQLGVVHRDVKPANLLVDARGNLWVTDFGLALFQSNPGLTATGDMVGTLRYMSPEQALARRGVVDHRTDVYALGATLYELLTLRPALPGTERVELLHQIAFTDPVPPRRLNLTLPVELETIVLKALAKAPEERYATAQELADDLHRLLEDRPIRARPPTPSQRLRRWARRHKSLAASLAVSAAVLLAGGIAVAVGDALHERTVSRREQRAKQEAEGQLYEALVAKAEGLRLARKPAYRVQALHDLGRAAALNVPEKDPKRIRAAVLACLGDPVGLDRARGILVTRGGRPRIPDTFKDVIKKCDPQHTKMATTPDGTWLGLAPGCGHIMLFGDDGRPPVDKELPPLGAVYDLEMSRDGRFLAAGFEEGAAVWTTPGLAPHLFFRGGQVFSVALHRSGRLLATAGRQIELWSLTSNRPLAHFDPPEYGATVDFSADGKYLLAVGAKQVFAWPVTETPEKRSLDGHAGGVPCVAFSPDGTRLASVSKDLTVRLWDAATGELRHTGRGHKNAIEAVAFSPDGALLATGDRGGAIGLWDGRTGAPAGGIPPAQGPGPVWRLQFSASGRFLAGVGQNGVVVWERQTIGETSTLFRTFHRPLSGALDVAIHPSESQLVAMTGDGNLVAFDFDKGTGPRRLAADVRREVRTLHFDATGKRLLFVSREGKLTMWDWDADTPPRETAEPALHLALGPGARWVAATTPSRATVVYDLQAGAETLALPEEAGDVWSLAWSSDGTRLAVGRSDGGVAIWDLEQVRARLAEVGITVPSTAAGGDRAPPPG
jgi:serine/threonine protein kinase/WD40 repeat protein